MSQQAELLRHKVRGMEQWEKSANEAMQEKES
jgi:hypothetical protein